MVQEVQQDMNMFKELDETEGIGYVERRLSYKTQIRDKVDTGYTKGDVEINMATTTTVNPGDTGYFDDSSIISGGEGWTVTGYKAYPEPGMYLLTWQMYTHSIDRLIEYLGLYVMRGGNLITVWQGGSGTSGYWGTTAFTFESEDELRMVYKYTGGNATNRVDGILKCLVLR